LQIEGSFDSLHDGMSRDRFISEAAEIAKRLGYNDIKQLRSNGQLQDKIASWNTYNSKLGTPIDLSQILNKITNMGKPSDNTKSEASSQE
jgi:hypothetical protein